MNNGWTPERKARQAKLIKQWQPWEHSTGPTTSEGKAISSLNAYKGGFREQVRVVRRLLRESERLIESFKVNDERKENEK